MWNPSDKGSHRPSVVAARSRPDTVRSARDRHAQAAPRDPEDLRLQPDRDTAPENNRRESISTYESCKTRNRARGRTTAASVSAQGLSYIWTRQRDLGDHKTGKPEDLPQPTGRGRGCARARLGAAWTTIHSRLLHSIFSADGRAGRTRQSQGRASHNGCSRWQRGCFAAKLPDAGVP